MERERERSLIRSMESSFSFSSFRYLSSKTRRQESRCLSVLTSLRPSVIPPSLRSSSFFLLFHPAIFSVGSFLPSDTSPVQSLLLEVLRKTTRRRRRRKFAQDRRRREEEEDGQQPSERRQDASVVFSFLDQAPRIYTRRKQDRRRRRKQPGEEEEERKRRILVLLYLSAIQSEST